MGLVLFGGGGAGACCACRAVLCVLCRAYAVPVFPPIAPAHAMQMPSPCHPMPLPRPAAPSASPSVPPPAPPPPCRAQSRSPPRSAPSTSTPTPRRRRCGTRSGACRRPVSGPAAGGRTRTLRLELPTACTQAAYTQAATAACGPCFQASFAPGTGPPYSFAPLPPKTNSNVRHQQAAAGDHVPAAAAAPHLQRRRAHRWGRAPLCRCCCSASAAAVFPKAPAASAPFPQPSISAQSRDRPPP